MTSLVLWSLRVHPIMAVHMRRLWILEGEGGQDSEFRFDCPRFVNQRQVMMNRLLLISNPTLDRSGVDKAAYCVCTRKFSASTLENLSWWCNKKTFKIRGTHHFVKVMCTRTIWSMVFIYRITDLSCGTLINMQRRIKRLIVLIQNGVIDSRLKKAC